MSKCHFGGERTKSEVTESSNTTQVSTDVGEAVISLYMQARAIYYLPTGLTQAA